jgi:hypothetical protein
MTFCDAFDIKNATEELKRPSQNSFQECFQHVCSCWQKCIDVEWECFEEKGSLNDWTVWYFSEIKLFQEHFEATTYIRGIETSHCIHEWPFGAKNRKRRQAAGRPVETRRPVKCRKQPQHWKKHCLTRCGRNRDSNGSSMNRPWKALHRTGSLLMFLFPHPWLDSVFILYCWQVLVMFSYPAFWLGPGFCSILFVISPFFLLLPRS